MHRLAAVFGISALSLLAFAYLGSQTAQAQTYTVLHAFTGGEDGDQPCAGLTPDGPGTFYGTTAGAQQDTGTAFQLKQTGDSWTLRTIASGLDAPLGRVVFGPHRNLYGTTVGGSCGFEGYPCGGVFSLQRSCSNDDCPWAMTVLYQFNSPTGSDGAEPAFDPVFDEAGNLYGTTAFGGADQWGVVFKLTPPADGGPGEWAETVLYNFTGGNDGEVPGGGVIFDTTGNLYGTTARGGAYGLGTVFELSPSGGGWVLTTLYAFQGGDDGQFPESALIFDGAGNLYGDTSGAGAAGGGTVFKLSPSGNSWTFSVLYGLPGASNEGPVGPVTMDAAGDVYGTTTGDGAFGAGSVFKLTATNGSWVYSDIYDFVSRGPGLISKGWRPLGNVTLDASGNLYSTAADGGTLDCPGGCGVVWKFTP